MTTARAALQGFSLVELSVVVAIIALVLLFGIDTGRTALEASDRLGTQEKLAVIKRALDQYAAIAGHYPCPAAPGLLPSDSAFGVEKRNGVSGCFNAGGDGLVNVGGTMIGMAPIRSLGLSDEYAADAWANKFLYAVTLSMTNTSTITGLNGAIEIRTGPRSGGNYPITGLATGAAGAGANYVLLSHGPNGEGAYPLNGTAVAISCGSRTDSVNCARNGVIYYDNAFNDGGQSASFFDDLVLWGSTITDGLPVSHAACSGDCEIWCAPCTLTVGGAGNSYLCGKFITSITALSGTCQATCMMAESEAQCP